jgi:flagellar L-ring protein precursor FlgH
MRLESMMPRGIAVLALLAAISVFASSAPGKKAEKKSTDLRADYVARLQKQFVPAQEEHTVGSLWTSDSALGDFSSDYKARNLNDTITIVVGVQTTAAQSGSVDSERSFSTNSAITGVMGRTPAKTNPLLAANSADKLKGQGSTASNTTFTTRLTGQVIAVLPNGNLVVEAGRKIFMNNQHEDIIVRGMVRPGDISPSNTVASTSLSNLEIEMKGKGIISDGTRKTNPIMKAVLVSCHAGASVCRNVAPCRASGARLRSGPQGADSRHHAD